MQAENIKEFYRGRLPHIQPIGAAFFVTFRLKDSIPRASLFKMKRDYEYSISCIKASSAGDMDHLLSKERQRFFMRYDRLLDRVKKGPHYLKNLQIAQLVAHELHRFDGQFYDLIAYCIMSNHVHILIDTSIQLPAELDLSVSESMEFEPLQNIMKRIKGPSAVYANRLLHRTGKFWQRESFDRYIRTEKQFRNTIAYILQNPVVARIVDEWKEYPFSYLKGVQ